MTQKLKKVAARIFCILSNIINMTLAVELIFYYEINNIGSDSLHGIRTQALTT